MYITLVGHLTCIVQAHIHKKNLTRSLHMEDSTFLLRQGLRSFRQIVIPYRMYKYSPTGPQYNMYVSGTFPRYTVESDANNPNITTLEIGYKQYLSQCFTRVHVIFFFTLLPMFTFLEICVQHRNTVFTLVWNNPGLRVSTFPIILPTRCNITTTKKRIIVNVKHG